MDNFQVKVVSMVFEGTGSLFYSPGFENLLRIRNPLVAAVVGAAVQVTMMEMAKTIRCSQGASCGWWGWMEEHLVAQVTSLKMEWKMIFIVD